MATSTTATAAAMFPTVRTIEFKTYLFHLTCSIIGPNLTWRANGHILYYGSTVLLSFTTLNISVIEHICNEQVIVTWKSFHTSNLSKTLVVSLGN